jgi:hypothetical protein
LEQVWAAVAKEALTMIFAGADATGFEPDARLTAMWLWTLSTAASNGNGATKAEDNEPVEDEEEDENANAKSKVGGFVLEYDAARKIAQGLGAHLERRERAHASCPLRSDLKLTLRVEVAPPEGVSPQKVDETKVALRELGLKDSLESV